MKGLIRIENDLYDIASRVLEIDSRYEVYYNNRRSRYEIHLEKALQVVVPFSKLDARTLSHLRKTRLEYYDRLIKKMERENTLLEFKSISKAKDSFAQCF